MSKSRRRFFFGLGVALSLALAVVILNLVPTIHDFAEGVSPFK
jgi:hypothetical protein